MNTNIVIRSLLNGIAGILALALFENLLHGTPFMQTLAAPTTLPIAVGATIGSFIGLRRKALRQ